MDGACATELKSHLSSAHVTPTSISLMAPLARFKGTRQEKAKYIKNRGQLDR
jgi:hypothetical protein